MQAPKLENLKLEEHDEITLKVLENHLIVSITDKFGRVTYANDNYCKLIGASRKFILGEANEILKCHLHTNKIYKDLWKVLKKGEKWEGILFHKVSNSRHHWLQTSVYPLKDENEETTKYLSIYNDITDYYQKQTTDNAVEVGNQTIVKKIEEITLSVNQRAKIIRAYNQSLKKDYDELVGLYIYDFVNEDYHEGIKSKIKEVFFDKKPSGFQFSSQQEELNKELYISEIQPVINKVGEVSHALISTELKTRDVKILRELNQVQTKYKSILKSFNHGIVVVTNAEGTIREWNKGAEKAFGYSEKEIVGKSITILISKHFMNKGIKELYRIKESNKSAELGETIEMIGVRKDGSEFPVEISVDDWFCEKERNYSAIMLDVSKRKKLEKKLLQKTQDLELFLYRSAHDLKAPLTSSEGLLELIKFEDIDTKTRKLVDLLSSSLNRGKLLLDNLAFASAISQKKTEVSVVNFEKEINKTLKALSGLDNFEDIHFDLNIRQTKRFYSNKELLSSVFQNLIQNAINYIEPKSEDYIPTIKIQVEQRSNSVEIIISDNGIGIAKESQAKIFDLYYRVNNEGTNGTGLGLYIVKCIIEDLNGTIDLDTTLAHGASFKILIPNLSKKN